MGPTGPLGLVLYIHSFIYSPFVYHLSIHACFHPSIYSSFHSSTHTSIHSSSHPSMHLSSHACIHPCIIHVFIHPSFHYPFFHSSFYLCSNVSTLHPFHSKRIQTVLQVTATCVLSMSISEARLTVDGPPGLGLGGDAQAQGWEVGD